MKIIVAGTRGIPNIMGGVETHCEELYPRLATLGCEVTVIRRSFYVNHYTNTETEYKGVKLKDIYAPHHKRVEAMVHTFLAVLYAKKQRADILHIHAIGPSLMVPFARLLGLKVIMTHHGADYERQKWGKVAKWMLKCGEKLGVKYANEVIVISESIKQSIQKKYQRFDSHLIFNGVNPPIISQETNYIHELGLEKGKYVFAMGRFVEEKGFHLLIKAFAQLKQPTYKLVIAGDADHETRYAEKLKALAYNNDIILTGFIKGEKLQELLSHTRLFVLPSFHEGLPIALLEAMSYGLNILASDIEANLAINLPPHCYFKSNDEQDLTLHIQECLQSNYSPKKYHLDAYNWDHIATETLKIYTSLKKNDSKC